MRWGMVGIVSERVEVEFPICISTTNKLQINPYAEGCYEGFAHNIQMRNFRGAFGCKCTGLGCTSCTASVGVYNKYNLPM